MVKKFIQIDDRGRPIEAAPAGKVGPQTITASGDVGRTVDVPSLTRVELLSLRSDSNGDAENSVFTVTIGKVSTTPIVPVAGRPDYFDLSILNGPMLIAPAGTIDIAHAYAVIEWGAGGSRFKACVDIYPEQVISFSGSFLRITVVNNQANDITVQAHVSLLPQAARKAATFTMGGINLDANETFDTSRIPQFTKSVKVLRAPATAPFTAYAMDGAASPIGEVIVAANADAPEMVFPGDANGFGIVNGATPAHYLIVYNLEL